MHWLHTRLTRFCLALLLCGALSGVNDVPSVQAADSPQPPNIVWIWADNLAYADLSVYGSRQKQTPVIDQLAANGVRFTQYYIAHAVCSPSRAALLTGRQPFRTGIVAVLRPDGPSGLPDDEITLGEALRERGYATKAIGKWHLGDQERYLPTQHGFDGYFGIPYSMDMLPTVLYRDNEIVERLPGQEAGNITERYTDEAIDFIAANRDRPFFLYLSHTIPHPPLTLPAEHATSDRPIYDLAIEHLDRQTGVLLDKLDEFGLRDNTLVCFSSDNGPMSRGGETGGLRGRIGEAYEGSLRVPLIARWPGRISPGRVAREPAIAYDIFPTLVRLAGGQLSDDREYDGQDIRPLLTGEGDFERRKPFIWVHDDRVSAIRDGRWKLHVSDRGRPLDPPDLYDVVADSGETQNVAAEQPEVAGRLMDAVTEFQKDVPMVWTLRYPVRDPAKRPSGVRRE